MSVCFEYLIAILTVLVIPFYYYYTKLYKIEKFMSNFPAPPSVPFFGNARDFTSNAAVLKTLHKYKKTHGNLIHLKLGPVGHFLVCTDEKFLEFILTNNRILRRSANLRYLEPWIGQGLVTSDGGPKWKMHRKLITPAFHFKILEQFIDIFENDGKILVEKLSKMSGSRSIDIYPYITLYTLDVICETAMGTKVDVQNNETSSYFQSVKDMSRIFLTRTVSILQQYDFFHRFTKDYIIQLNSVKVLHDYSNQVINKKREELRKRPQKNDKDINEIGIKQKKVFLDLFLEATVDGQGLSHEEIREEVDTLLLGGHETTATAISFVLFSLATNKDVQEKVFEEQKQIFGDDFKNIEINYVNLQEMRYLENVIKEGLRMYTPIPIYGREIDQDIEYDAMVIPQGTRIIIFAHGIHMDPKFYPDPEKFDPSRFEKTDGRPTFAYIPFGAGSRNCIGQKFAFLEIKTIVSKIVRNFELFPAVPSHKLALVAETVLKSPNGVKIGLRLR